MGAIACLMLFSGCMSADDHYQSLHSARERQLTLGVVQRDIHAGISRDQVAVKLGSPNIVTKDQSGLETWIYDKIATEKSYSSSRNGIASGIGAGGVDDGGTLIGGGTAAGHSRKSGASSTTQRTLTVVIKFDDEGLVQSVDYHTSRF